MEEGDDDDDDDDDCAFVGHCTKNKIKLTSVIFICRVLCALGTDWCILLRAA